MIGTSQLVLVVISMCSVRGRSRAARAAVGETLNGVLGLIIRPQEWSKFFHGRLVLFMSVTNKSKRSGQKFSAKRQLTNHYESCVCEA
jgi:hypothetical protein